MVAPLKVGIAGLGTVGAEVVRLIEGQSAALSARSGRPIRVVAVAIVTSPGQCISRRKLMSSRASTEVAPGGLSR